MVVPQREWSWSCGPEASVLVNTHIPVGELRYSNIARSKSSHFLSMFLAIFTTDSAFPLPLGSYGEAVMWLKSYSEANH